MARLLRHLRYAVVEGIRGLGRAKLSTSVAITVLAAALLLFGIFFTLILRLEGELNAIARQADLEVVVAGNTTERHMTDLQAQLRALDGIREVTFHSKAEAAALMKQRHGLDVVALVGVNPLPATFAVALDDRPRSDAALDSLVTYITTLAHVDDIVYDRDLWQRFRRLRSRLSIIFAGLGLTLLIIGALVVGNTIRLTIYARRDILRVLGFLGAPRGFIRRPFLVEGFVQGTCAAIISIALLHVLWEALGLISGYRLAPPIAVYGVLLAAGWGLGLAGAHWTLRRFLP